MTVSMGRRPWLRSGFPTGYTRAKRAVGNGIGHDYNFVMNYYDADVDRVVVGSANPDLDLGIYSVCVEPTNRCTGKCPYCLIENHQKDPTFEQIKRHISALADLGVLRVGWGGGEPLVRNDIYHLGLFAKEYGMGSLLRTSGMYAVDIQASNEAFDWIDISFDSHERGVFELIRPGVSFDTLVKNIRNLISDSQRVRVSILLTTMNKQTVFNTLDWLADEGVAHVRLQQLVKRGSAVKNWNYLHLEQDEAKTLLSDALIHAKTKGLLAFELKSVSETTLIILKPNGAVYSGNPDGQRLVGHILQPDIGGALYAVVGAQQAKTYIHGQ